MLAANTDCAEVKSLLRDMSDDDQTAAIVFPDVSAAAMEAVVGALYTGRLEAPNDMRSGQKMGETFQSFHRAHFGNTELYRGEVIYWVKGSVRILF